MEIRRGKVYTITTPESATLEFEVGGDAERIMAFFLDLLLIFLATLAVWVGAIFVFAASTSGAVLGMALIAAFCIRQFYFLYCELRRSGTTPGKRNQGLRVVARDGGPLTGEMIVARNLVRDIEFFLPIMVIMAPEALFPNGGGLVALLGTLWLLIFLLMPWFNRYRLRCGDLIAGTVVVRQPRVRLLPDVAETVVTQRFGAGAAPEGYSFTQEQLSHYGIKELEVLEDLFRRREDGRATEEILKEVCLKICKKIEWTESQPPDDPFRFLRDFYRAQRWQLEQRLLLGNRKKDKHDRSPGGV